MNAKLRRPLTLVGALLLISACQSPSPVAQSNSAQNPVQPPLASSVPVLDYVSSNHVLNPAYTSPMLKPSQIQISGEIQIVKQTVTVKVKLPPLAARGFATQALDLNAATLVGATLSDSYGRTYTAVGADGNGRVTYPPSGNLTLNFTGVLPDALIFLDLQTRDAVGDILQAELSSVISNTSVSDSSGVINFQTTPSAKAIKSLLSTNATRARAINLADLNTLMTAITGYAAGPPIAYTTHPSLVNTTLLATDLAGTNPNLLTAANYRQAGATVSATVTGLVGSDKLNIQITDAASAVKADVVNGTGIQIPAATPGNGLKVMVGAVASNSTQYSFAVTSGNTVNLTNGNTTNVTIVATPATVSLSTLTPSAGSIGSSVVIAGSGFSTVTGNNIVKFGSATATVTLASTTSLTVTVPAGISGTQPVSVEVGSASSNSLNYQVTPTITSISPATGSTGDSITLNGTGFDGTTMGNNTVSFGSGTGTVTAATPTSLTVTLNEAPAGTANASVTVAAQTSATSAFTRLPKLTAVTAAQNIAGKAALVRGLTITLTGTNFDPNPSNNQVRFTLANSSVVTAIPTAATATSLTVTVPATVEIAGDAGVVVRSNTQDSGSVTATVPTINLQFDGGFR